MEYTSRQFSDGKWAVFSGKAYFIDTITSNEEEAKIEALKMSAIWYRDQMDKAHKELEKIGAVNEYDPYDYLA